MNKSPGGKKDVFTKKSRKNSHLQKFLEAAGIIVNNESNQFLCKFEMFLKSHRLLPHK